MAEAMVNAEQDTREKADSPECAVCLQPCVHPAQLPCGHIFCYLCVKGFANQNKRCAMCRQEIPRDFVEQPHLLQRPQPLEAIEGFDGGYQWFYEGRNGWWKYDSRASQEIEEAYKLELPQFDLIICGWWQYDERTSKELEISYKKGEKSIELLIAGFLYIVDFENMLQLRRNDPSRRRQIKRDFFSIPKKGIAGLRTDPLPPTSENSEGRPGSPTRGPADAVTPTTPSNTPQSPTSGRESPNQEQDFQATVERISNLRLDSNDGEASRSNESGRNSWINLPSNDDLENNPEISRGVGESLGIYDQEGDIEFERNNLGLMANSGIHSETERSNFATAGSSSESSGANSENLRARCNSENNEDEERESRGNLGILAGYWRDKYMGRHRRDD